MKTEKIIIITTTKTNTLVTHLVFDETFNTKIGLDDKGLVLKPNHGG